LRDDHAEKFNRYEHPPDSFTNRIIHEEEMKMADNGLTGSTAYSDARYAHPFFLPAPHEKRLAINGHKKITDWSKEQLGPLPPVVRKGRMDLAEIIGSDGVKEIAQLGEIRFHALGDTGVGHAQEAEQVSEDMATDYKPGAGGLNPAFLFHLGDVIYGPRKEQKSRCVPRPLPFGSRA
jgi:hypothetical protein